MANESMSDERLAEIRASVCFFDYGENDADTDAIHDLLAEVERLRAYIAQLHDHRRVVISDHDTYTDDLRAENAAMREIVRQVATSNPYGGWYPATNTPPGVVCRWCMERAQTPAQCQHDVECTWSRARAFVAQWDTQEDR